MSSTWHKVLSNKCFGRMAKVLVPFLMSTHIGPRPIWLVRCGDYDEADGSLSTEGKRFAVALEAFVRAGAAPAGPMCLRAAAMDLTRACS